jgi:hypothetical protein
LYFKETLALAGVSFIMIIEVRYINEETVSMLL